MLTYKKYNFTDLQAFAVWKLQSEESGIIEIEKCDCLNNLVGNLKLQLPETRRNILVSLAIEELTKQIFSYMSSLNYAKDRDNLIWRIQSDPEILKGKPNIRGMRISVYCILDLVESGMTDLEILADFPYLVLEDIYACLYYKTLKGL